MDHSLNDPGLTGPASPYDLPDPCPECGAPDAEYLEHEPGCPSGYPTRDLTPAEIELANYQDDPKASPGQKCSACGGPASRQCRCGCGAAYCLACRRAGKIG